MCYQTEYSCNPSLFQYYLKVFGNTVNIKAYTPIIGIYIALICRAYMQEVVVYNIEL